MATLELQELGHRYEESKQRSSFAIENLNLRFEDGSANALLGPSGCGKTTLLNLLSGLLHPRSGTISIDGRDVTREDPVKRHIAQVFQFPVVYETMSVRGNLAFPLVNRRVPREQIAARVEEIAELLGVANILDQAANRLSASEKQKVALGRGIVRTDTAAVLLDEPLTVIDPVQRGELRKRLKRVQRELGLTMIYVTHDQQEALTFADRVTVMKDGRIEQTASPAELHAEPASAFVGYFIGSPGMNLIDGQVIDGQFRFAAYAQPLSNTIQGSKIQLGIRPKYVAVTREGASDGFAFSVAAVEDKGAYQVLTLQSGEVRIKARIPEEQPAREGDRVRVRFPIEHTSYFSEGRRIG